MIGFIGTGNMGTAIIKGLLSKKVDSNTINVYDLNANAILGLRDLNLNICTSSQMVAQKSKYIFLAVKPNVYEKTLKEIREFLTEDSIIIAMAAGFDIAKMKNIIGTKKIVRIMPNTPALVNKGFTVVCFDDLVLQEEKAIVTELLRAFSEVKEISESYLNAYSAISGSGPAYIFMMIEAMADAAVLMGIPRADAYKAVEHTIIGSAELAAQLGKHPGELKDMVCSPGGTTIEGVRTLEETGFRSSIIECLINIYKKNLDISKIR
jgi:pyrroline-5-carboxylate reductase